MQNACGRPLRGKKKPALFVLAAPSFRGMHSWYYAASRGPPVEELSDIPVGELFQANESFGMYKARRTCAGGAPTAAGGSGWNKEPCVVTQVLNLGTVRPPTLAFRHHICCAIVMAKRDTASRYVWSTRRLNRTGMSIATQYRTHAIEFLSLACKMNDSCRTSEVIDEALYWFNMAERGESQISANLTERVPPARRRGASK
jgi:hypothetical protein